MDKALVTFVGAGLSTIVIGLGRKVPVGAIANGHHLVQHLLETNPVEARQIVEGVVREIFGDWRKSGVPIAVADAHFAALPTVLDQHRVAQNILVGGLAVAKKSEKEGRRAVTVPARRIAAEFVTSAREAQAFGRSKLSDQVAFYLTERLFAHLLLERRTLIGLTTSMNTYFMKSMWTGGSTPDHDATPALGDGDAPVAASHPGPVGRTDGRRPGSFGGEETSRVLFKPIALPQRERPLYSSAVAPQPPRAPLAAPVAAAVVPPPAPLDLEPAELAPDLSWPLPSLESLEAEVAPVATTLVSSARDDGPEPAFPVREPGHAPLEIPAFERPPVEASDFVSPSLDESAFNLTTFEPTPFAGPSDGTWEQSAGSIAAPGTDALEPTFGPGADADLEPLLPPSEPAPEDLAALFQPEPPPATDAVASDPTPAVAGPIELPRPLGPSRVRRVRKIMLSPMPVEPPAAPTSARPVELPAPAVTSPIETFVAETASAAAPRHEATSDANHRMPAEVPSSADAAEPLTAAPVGSEPATVTSAGSSDPIGAGPATDQPLPEPADQAAGSPSATAIVIARASGGDLTVRLVAALERAIMANTRAASVAAEPLKAASKSIADVMQRLTLRIAEADGSAGALGAALSALREGRFEEARLQLAAAEASTRADGADGGDLARAAMRSVVEQRLMLTDIETACGATAAAAEHLAVAVAAVPLEDRLRRWTLSIRYARMLQRRLDEAGRPLPAPDTLAVVVEAYRAALSVVGEGDVPQDLARAQVELVTLLNRSARITNSIEPLNEAAATIDPTIERLARSRAMDDWAEAHTQRGIVYAQLARHEELVEHFETAAESLNSALGHVSLQRSPLVWAEARAWLGLLLKDWGRKTATASRIAEGITHLRAVCDAEGLDLARAGFTLPELTIAVADAITALGMARNEPGLHATAVATLARTIARTNGTIDADIEAQLYDRLAEAMWQLGAFREDPELLVRAGQAIDRAIELFLTAGDERRAESRIGDLERLHDYRANLIEARANRQGRGVRVSA